MGRTNNRGQKKSFTDHSSVTSSRGSQTSPWEKNQEFSLGWPAQRLERPRDQVVPGSVLAKGTYPGYRLGEG